MKSVKAIIIALASTFIAPSAFATTTGVTVTENQWLDDHYKLECRCTVGAHVRFSTKDNWNTARVNYYFIGSTELWQLDIGVNGNFWVRLSDAYQQNQRAGHDWYGLPSGTGPIALNIYHGYIKDPEVFSFKLISNSDNPDAVWDKLNSGFGIAQYFFGRELQQAAKIQIIDRSITAFSLNLFDIDPNFTLSTVPLPPSFIAYISLIVLMMRRPIARKGRRLLGITSSSLSPAGGLT